MELGCLVMSGGVLLERRPLGGTLAARFICMKLCSTFALHGYWVLARRSKISAFCLAKS